MPLIQYLEAGAGGSLSSRQPVLHRNTVLVKPYLKKEKNISGNSGTQRAYRKGKKEWAGRPYTD